MHGFVYMYVHMCVLLFCSVLLYCVLSTCTLHIGQLIFSSLAVSLELYLSLCSVLRRTGPPNAGDPWPLLGNLVPLDGQGIGLPLAHLDDSGLVHPQQSAGLL